MGDNIRDARFFETDQARAQHSWRTVLQIFVAHASLAEQLNWADDGDWEQARHRLALIFHSFDK